MGPVGAGLAVEGEAITLGDAVKARISMNAPIAASTIMANSLVRFSAPTCICLLAPALLERFQHQLPLDQAALLLVKFQAIDHHQHLLALKSIDELDEIQVVRTEGGLHQQTFDSV